ncbi:AAA family ATPase, partial [Cryptosporangium japonicum]
MTAEPLVIGRDTELDELDRRLRDLPRGGGALTLDGEAGIGKTVLAAAATRRATNAGYRVLSGHGVRGEAGVGFSGLRRLLEPVLDRADALPERQRVAVLTALGCLDGPQPGLLLLGLSTLGLLDEIAAERPLVVVMEDLHWVDPSSLDVLGFVSRRLSDTPILLLATRRPDPLTDGASPASLAGAVVRLAPLS